MEYTSLIYAQGCLLAAALCVACRFLYCLFISSSLDNIPGPPSPSFLKGNIPQLYHRQEGWAFHRMIADQYGRVATVTEIFGKKSLFLFDPTAMYSILMKNHTAYEVATKQLARRMILTGPSLLATTGGQHRAQRKSLNPVFSIVHMRYLSPIFYEIAHKLRSAISLELQGNKGEIDIVVWLGRVALELIGQGGLGYSFDPLDSVREDSFGYALKAFQPVQASNRIWLLCAPYCHLLGPSWFRRFLANFVPDKKFQKLRHLLDVMDERSRYILNSKRDAFLKGNKAVKEQIGRGKDIMSILLKANMQASEEEQLPEEEVLAQMSAFVLAGTDTTSSALARILDLLAHHPEVQEKLRNEIRNARCGKDLPYDELVNLPYLEAVCRETLRLYPPAGLINREATRDTTLPLSQPIHGRDGTMVNEIFVPRGTNIFIAIWLSNINKDLWGDDADEWKPERWLSPLPDSLKETKIPGVYSNLMTFAGGTRACIGFKFSQLEMKIVLSILLESFVFRPASSKSVYWNFSNIAFPSTGKTDLRPSLPIHVELVQD